jgi:signal transduction histidine kinase
MPIHVDGRLWGMIAVGSGQGPLPDGTEQRMTEFTDLVATAVANAQNRAALEASRDELVPALARLPEPVEVAAYYVCSEALTNATKHARASVVCVAAGQRGDSLRLSIRDDGAGGADPAGGSGLIGLRDRAEALGGSLEVSSPPGEGTLILVQLPLRLH